MVMGAAIARGRQMANRDFAAADDFQDGGQRGCRFSDRGGSLRQPEPGSDIRSKSRDGTQTVTLRICADYFSRLRKMMMCSHGNTPMVSVQSKANAPISFLTWAAV